ncbi:MAG: DNA polymerase III subunit gamma/tau, partial [Chromatiaceae bacterium]|nr:DNA polymerase III subunit gamma/tau [Chromatiaceae bacterium]
AHILTVEGLPYEDQALALLARAADGSMRDGLSLLDQAIAFGGGRVGADDIRAMLGTVGRDMSLNLLSALASRDGARLLAEVGRIHELTPDFGGLLQELLGFLHRIALFQQVPATLPADDPERETLEALARVLAPEDLQLFYQIALLGQADMPLAPDPRTGMEMVLLRMLAFRPGDQESRAGRVAGGDEALPAAPRPTAPAASPPLRPAVPPGAAASRPAGERPLDGSSGVPPVTAAPSAAAARAAPPAPGRESPASAALAAARLATAVDKPGSGRPRPSAPAPSSAMPTAAVAGAATQVPRPLVDPAAPPAPAATPGQAPATAFPAGAAPRLEDKEHWHALVAAIDLGGLASELARNCELLDWDGQRLRLILDQASERLRVETTEQRLRSALEVVLGEGLRLEIQVARPESETPSQRRARARRERQRAAEEAMVHDPVAVALRDTLGARLIPGTVQPPS